MRIRLLCIPVFLLACLCCACQQSDSAAKPGVAVVDLARVMRDSEPGKQGVAFLEGLQSTMQNKLNDLQKKLEVNPKDEDAQKELQTVYMSAQQRIQTEQQNVVSTLYDTIQRILNAYRLEKGYVAIIASETVVSYDASIDVTNDILAAVNKQKLEFKPITAEPDASSAATAGDSDAKEASKPEAKDAAKPEERRDAKPEAKDAAQGAGKDSAPNRP